MSFLRVPNDIQKAEVCDATMFEEVLMPGSKKRIA
jgi:hypothetical protein